MGIKRENKSCMLLFALVADHFSIVVY